MDLARRQAMDAQRFDPMRRKKNPLNLSIPSAKPHSDMGQALRRLSQPELPPNGVVGGVWSDHELVLVPLEVTSHRISMGSILAESFTSSDASSDTAASDASYASSTYFTSSTPSLPEDDDVLDPSPSRATSATRQVVDTYDRDDLIITRTIIRPSGTHHHHRHATTTTPLLRGLFSSTAPHHHARSSPPPSSSPPISRPTSPVFARPTTPVFQALNCFRPPASAFEQEAEAEAAAYYYRHRDGASSQPVLQVIVTQTREQYEQDLAFKEVVREVYPEAGARRGRGVQHQ